VDVNGSREEWTLTQLILRPSHQDHLVLADLLAPTARTSSLAHSAHIAEVVLDAHFVAAGKPIAGVAKEFGVPIVVDPLTQYLQAPIKSDDPWLNLSYANAGPLSPEAVGDLLGSPEFLDEVLEVQLSGDASVVVPPYFHSSGPKDAWHSVAIRAMHETRLRLDHLGVSLPIRPTLSGRLDAFSDSGAWSVGVDEFATNALLIGAQGITLQLSPLGGDADSFAKLSAFAETVKHVQALGLKVFAARQGRLAPLLAALGVEATETGLAYGDHTDVSSLFASRKPRRNTPARGGGLPKRRYLPHLNRFVSEDAYLALLANRSTQALMSCDDDVYCCPNGPRSMASDRRGHAVRSRLRLLSTLNAAPMEGGLRILTAEELARVHVDRTATVNRILTANRIPSLGDKTVTSQYAVLRELAHDYHPERQQLT
jgi:hypothetical protein